MATKGRTEKVGDERSRHSSLREAVLLGSLCGVIACNYFGFGLGRAICLGVLATSLGTPAGDVFHGRARHLS